MIRNKLSSSANRLSPGSINEEMKRMDKSVDILCKKVRWFSIILTFHRDEAGLRSGHKRYNVGDHRERQVEGPVPNVGTRGQNT